MHFFEYLNALKQLISTFPLMLCEMGQIGEMEGRERYSREQFTFIDCWISLHLRLLNGGYLFYFDDLGICYLTVHKWNIKLHT